MDSSLGEEGDSSVCGLDNTIARLSSDTAAGTMSKLHGRVVSLIPMFNRSGERWQNRTGTVSLY